MPSTGSSVSVAMAERRRPKRIAHATGDGRILIPLLAQPDWLFLTIRTCKTLTKDKRGMGSRGAPSRPRARNDVARAVLARDAALERISRTRRWIVVASVALSGALAGLASTLLPGKSFAASKSESSSATGAQGASATARGSRSRSASASSSGAASASSSVPKMPAPAGPAQLGLAGAAQSLPPVQSSPPPAAAPAPAPSGGGGAVVSGGS